MKNKRKVMLIWSILILLVSLSMPVKAQNELVFNNLLTKVELKDSIKRSEYNALLADNVNLESKFNLKDEFEKSNMSIRVKNQSTSNSCWAFAYSSIIETTMSKKAGALSKEISPMHSEYVTAQMFNRALGSGGGPRLSVAYSVSGKGPVEESQMPFSSFFTGSFKPLEEAGNLDKPLAAKVNDVVEFPVMYKKLEGDTVKYYKDETKTKEYSDSEVKAARDLLKKHIKEYGAVAANMYITQEDYYNTSTAAYNYNEYSSAQPVNHLIALVGWDDDYEITNFKEGKQPKNKGAYIALSSYGEEFGKGGYMYISYEDAYIDQGLMGIRDITECTNGETGYDYIHQYDELGMNLGVPLGTQVPEKTVYAASKYNKSAPSGKDEYINEVGLYIATTSGVKVYINPDGDDLIPEKFEEVASPETALETGYHIIKLATPLKIEGNKFVVKVKYTNQEGAYIPVEANYKSMGLDDTSQFYNNVAANEDETFVSTDENSWLDITKISVIANGAQRSMKDASVCMKVFTTYEDIPEQESPLPSPTPSLSPSPSTKPPEDQNVSVQSVELDKSELTLEEGKQSNLTVIFNPTNATNKNVTWSSSDESVATVSDRGIITAKSAGKTTITVRTEDGNKSAKCELTVTAKREDPDDIYDDDDSDNYNGSGSSGVSGNASTGTSIYTRLPKAGTEAIILIIAIVTVTSIVIFIRYRKYKDIK